MTASMTSVVSGKIFMLDQEGTMVKIATDTWTTGWIQQGGQNAVHQTLQVTSTAIRAFAWTKLVHRLSKT